MNQILSRKKWREYKAQGIQSYSIDETLRLSHTGSKINDLLRSDIHRLMPLKTYLAQSPSNKQVV